MSHYVYEPLDSSSNEIRILRFLDPLTGKPDLIHCTLCRVSLDQLLPAYKDFKLELNFLSQRELAIRWCESYFSDKPWSPYQISTTLISASRYRAESQELYTSTGGHADEDDNIPIPLRFTWGDFETLSYCWGSDVCDKYILVDSLPLQVPTNFEEMLRHVQHLPEARSGMGFWADGICINQMDLSEKESQIGLMKRIYAEASSTVIWLGPSHKGSDIAIAILEEHFRDCEPGTGDAGYWYLSSGTKQGVDAQGLQSLLDLWSRDYFTRMWIIQELALNKSLSLFLCGNKQFPRLVLQDACHWVREHSGDVAQAIISGTAGNAAHVSPDHVWNIAANVFRLITLSTSEGDVDTLYDLAHKSQVKEPHDKVYGLLGLLPDYLAAKIVPDYTKPVKVVFTEFATLLLQNCRRLDEVLSWSTVDAQTASPFWVPNWMKPHYRNHIQWFRKFNAGGPDAPGQVLLPDGKTLECKGVYVDSIEHTSSPSSEKLPYQTTCPFQVRLHSIDGPSADLKSIVNRTLLHSHPKARVGASLLDLRWVDWDVLNGSTTKVHIMDEIHSSSHHWQSFDRFRQTNANFIISGWRLRDFFPQKLVPDLSNPFGSLNQDSELRGLEVAPRSAGYNDASFADSNMGGQSELFTEDNNNEQSDENQTFIVSPQPEALIPGHVKYATTYEDHLWNLQLTAVALRNRRLFTTHTGLLGLAPDEIQEGDTVAVLKGCSYPVVLRPYQHGFKYVGECYIDGLMDGEGFEATNSNEYRVVDILIL
jgi:hypothetical protein